VPLWPLEITIYVTVLVVACGCMMLLALLDIWATRQNLRRIQSEQMAAQHRLAREIRSARGSSDAKR
jgi:hypothetical protein